MKLLAALAVVAAVLQADVEQPSFEYARMLEAPEGAPVLFEPDGAMYGHSRDGFPDLRVLDADGEQVPWRRGPTPDAVPSRQVELVARGRRGGIVSVVVDRGSAQPLIDRIELQIPDRAFVGSVVVQGSTTGAEGSYARLSRTQIYSVRGAVRARSTTAVFPATDYRFFLVQASGVSNIRGASVAHDPEHALLQPVPAKIEISQQPRGTVATVDLGFRRVPVDAIRVVSTTDRYIRRVTVMASPDATNNRQVAQGRIARFRGADLSRVPVSASGIGARYLQLTIGNGDDEPLAGLRVIVEAAQRPLLLAEGYRPPYRLLYGAAAAVAAPTYDFAQLPAGATGIDRARAGSLGPEQANDLFEPPGDTRTFFERNDGLIQVALVLAALVVAAGGFLALRRRT